MAPAAEWGAAAGAELERLRAVEVEDRTRGKVVLPQHYAIVKRLRRVVDRPMRRDDGHLNIMLTSVTRLGDGESMDGEAAARLAMARARRASGMPSVQELRGLGGLDGVLVPLLVAVHEPLAVGRSKVLLA